MYPIYKITKVFLILLSYDVLEILYVLQHSSDYPRFKHSVATCG